jgi:MFS family permease
VVLALFSGAMNTAALTGLFLLLGAFMGTVMAVVQVSVQSVAGPQRLGEAAASVQFSRSIGAAFGTALVATLLFAFLTIRNPESARLFGVMVQHAGQAGVVLPPIGAAIQTDIALFTTCGFFLALTNPLKRI